MRITILVSIIFILSIRLLITKPIDENSAYKIANNYLNNKANSDLSNQIHLVSKSVDISHNLLNQSISQTDYHYYIFNNSGRGFVIISGDDATYPILAYSDESIFDESNISPATESWLNLYRIQIEFIRDNNIQSNEFIKSEWENISKKELNRNKIQKGIEPLIRTKWNQRPFVNDLCPYDTAVKARAITGCVANAMAQVMKYWHYPATGSGIHSYTHYKYGKLTANFGATTYEWEKMPNIVSDTNIAVATLMFHCGVAVDMNYGTSASGASSNAVPLAFINFFNYDKNLEIINKNNYDEAVWISILKNELDNARPICYTGVGTGGHEFVCDGYNEDDFFHFNWGWGGASDGYFRINELNPGNMSFSGFQQAVVGMMPPADKLEPSLILSKDVKASNSKVKYATSFTITTNLRNNRDVDFLGEYVATIFDNNGDFVDYFGIITNADTLFGYKNFIDDLTFTYSGSMKLLPGKYKVYINYRKKGGTWKQLRPSISDTITKGYTDIEIYNNNPLRLFSNLNLSVKNLICQDNDININFNIVNFGSTTFKGFIGVALYDTTNKLIKIIANKEETEGIDANGKELEELSFDTQITKDVSPGTYLLSGIYKELQSSDYSILGSYSQFINPVFITLVPKPEFDDNFEPNNDISLASKLELEFINDTISQNIQLINIRNSTDVDIYKINLEDGYDYLLAAEIIDIYNQGNNMTLDGSLSYSLDGINWSEYFDRELDPQLTLFGKSNVYLKVISNIPENSGTYNLNLNIFRKKWAPIISIGGSMSFEKIEVGDSVQKSFILKNIGKAEMIVDTLLCPEGYYTDWTKGTLAKDEFKEIAITFKPSKSKIFAGQVVIRSNAVDGTNFFQVYGTGSSTTGTPIIVLSGNMDFGKVNIGDTTSKILTIANAGRTTLSIYSIDYPDEDFYDEWYNGEILPDAEEEIEVVFTPTKVKYYFGEITMNCNTSQGDLSIDIMAQGVDPKSVNNSADGKYDITLDSYNYTLKIVSKENIDGFFEIYNITGQKVLNNDINNHNFILVDLSTIPIGKYFVKIEDKFGNTEIVPINVIK